MFLRAICLIIIVSEVFQVQCEPREFAKEDKEINKIILGHSSQRYFGVKRNANENNFKMSGAKAKKVWMIVRHGIRGARRPEIPVLSKLDTFAQQIVNKFQNENKVPFTQNGWNKLKSFKFAECFKCQGRTKAISTEGVRELEAIASNYKRRFPELFVGTYSPEQFLILHSIQERCKESMQIFFGKIFGENEATRINGSISGEYVEIVEGLRVYEENLPQNYVKPVNVEYEKFIKSGKYKSMVERIAKLFRFEATTYEVKQEMVSTIFNMCRYEEAWDASDSVWCSFFKKDDIHMLEYAVDLLNFYDYGYGFEQNKNIVCPAVRNMINILKGNSKPVTAYFTHSPEISLQLVAMNAYRENQMLTAENYESMSKRVWHSSKLIPYGANLAAVLYGNNQVKFFMNEELIEFSWCKRGACNLSDLEKNFKNCFAN